MLGSIHRKTLAKIHQIFLLNRFFLAANLNDDQRRMLLAFVTSSLPASCPSTKTRHSPSFPSSEVAFFSRFFRSLLDVAVSVVVDAPRDRRSRRTVKPKRRVAQLRGRLADLSHPCRSTDHFPSPFLPASTLLACTPPAAAAACDVADANVGIVAGSIPKPPNVGDRSNLGAADPGEDIMFGGGGLAIPKGGRC